MYRLPLEIACVFYFLWCLFDEMSNINAAREQFYKKDKSKTCCGICRQGTVICWNSGWDCFDIVTAILSTVTIVCTWLFSFVVPLYGTQHEDVVSVFFLLVGCFVSSTYLFCGHLSLFLTIF